MLSNHVTLLPSISAPWCLQICNHSPLLPLPFPLLMCCKYTIPYIEVSGMRGWWRAGPIIFSTSSSCNDPWVEELHFAKGCLQTTKQDTNYFNFFICCSLLETVSLNPNGMEVLGFWDLVSFLLMNLANFLKCCHHLDFSCKRTKPDDNKSDSNTLYMTTMIYFLWIAV